MTGETEAACGYRFTRAGAPQPTCGLPLEPRCQESPRHCYWHCSCHDVAEEKRTSPDVKSRLEKAVQEGAHLEGAYLWGAQLQGASLWAAHLEDAMLMEAQLQGARLSDAQLDGATVYGIGLDRSTQCESTAWGTPREEIDHVWRHAAAVFHTLREHYRESGNEQRMDEFYIREARCRHLAQHGWPRRAIWQVHRVVWGYGAIPCLVFAWMAFLVLVFGLVVFPVIGVNVPASGAAVSHSVVDGLALSLITFSTLGYGNTYPASKFGQMLAGFEAMLAMVLVAMFVVSLTRRYVRG